MPEYIKRMSAMTICERYSQHCFETNDNKGQDIADRIFDEITEIPTADVVKVVRCKDCKYCQTLNHDLTTSYFCEVLKRPAIVEPTDFCSYGELKELNNNAV